MPHDKGDGPPHNKPFWSSNTRFLKAGVLCFIRIRNKNVPNARELIRFGIGWFCDKLIESIYWYQNSLRM